MISSFALNLVVKGQEFAMLEIGGSNFKLKTNPNSSLKGVYSLTHIVLVDKRPDVCLKYVISDPNLITKH